MSLLLTGFTPFGVHAVNSSQAVVDALAAEATGLVTAVLRTEYRFAGAEIVRLIREKKPSAIVCLGMNERSGQVRLETAAWNWDNCPLPDNAGELRRGLPIIEGAPRYYPSTLPVGRLAGLLRREGIDAAISDNAGNYLCNHVFFQACHENASGSPGVPCGFIHIPPLLGSPGAPDTARPLEPLLRAIRLCLSEIAREAGNADAWK
jgi:pyroglutamyl-peptidase